MSKSYTITVTDNEYSGLLKVAEKDSITVKQLIVNQLKYYLKTVVHSFIYDTTDLTDEQQAELRLRLTETKLSYLSSLTP